MSYAHAGVERSLKSVVEVKEFMIELNIRICFSEQPIEKNSIDIFPGTNICK